MRRIFLAAALIVICVSSAQAFPVIFDNIGPNGGVLFHSGDSQPSQLDFGFGFDSGMADDFRLPPSSDDSGNWLVTDIEWYGRFGTGLPTPIAGFNIIFWPDDAGQPAGSDAAGAPPKYNQALAIYSNVPAIAAPSGAGDDSFQYSAVLPSTFLAQPGVNYWIEIQAQVNFPPLWLSDLTVSSQFTRPHYGFTLLGSPFWTDLAATHDVAFRLGGIPFPEPASILPCVLLAAMRGRRER